METDLIARLREHAENMYVDFLNDAADALEKQARRIAELEKIVSFESEHNAELRDALATKDARIAELTAALKIYAEARCSGMMCSFDDGDAARDALEKKE